MSGPPRWVFVTLTVSLLVSIPIVGQHTYSVPGADVEVVSVVPFTATAGGVVYEIQARYRASQRVRISGVHTATGTGSVTYLAREPVLILANSDTGATLAEWRLSPTGDPAGSPSKDLPSVGDFAAAPLTRSKSKKGGDLENHVDAVLARYFTQGVEPLTYRLPPYRVVTTFRSLEDVRWPYTGKVAVQIEFPIDSNGFRLSWIAEESRVGSSTWESASSKDVKDAADAFITGRLIADLVQ